ncbi:ABC-F family ATP-binding cassette domain-containing protein [Savagea sp. SN6]|uniref:ABC-F family ATP-binding cassette domain-containing protein n=1 Tax=Savagea serpentis TaxID=2785297 RepID=A0A8J7GAC4_9BACL|nr:ABC-F family ATP-binding cassette domain-containing protein [Savagea serpentis]MBF4502218.1 ABC-F family ATP-binding cassette domain-containing protein [Savagea serpentis]
MIVLQVNRLTKSFSGVPIIENAQLEVQHRDRVALVGRNGAGKSTLLKIIAGEMNYDEGDIIIPKDITVGYLEQHSHIDSELSIWDEMLTVFEPVRQMEKQMRHLEQQMANLNPQADQEAYDEVFKAYDAIQVDFTNNKGYQYESDIRSILHGMQFYPEHYERPVNVLSGGEKTRLALAKMLLQNPKLLILDEPTNHLDIETLSWLEKYLASYEGAILIVSHDRYFLDQITTITYEIARNEVTKYPGNYSFYLDEKAKTYERDMKRFEREQTEKAKLEQFIQKNIARASTSKMAKSRRKVLNKTEWMDAPDGDERSAQFSFSTKKQSGNDVLSVDDLAIGYGQNVLAQQIDMRVYRGERIAIVGPNGVGKSTLLKSIVKRDTPIAGSIRYGTNVEIGYYDQEQATLVGNGTVLQEIWNDWPLMQEKDIRTLLGRFLFSGDDVEKPVASLSGGEKARLSLAKLMLEQSNTLILDEPTNHLDLDSKEVLENALDDFPGTLLFVSHDRYFINRLATKVMELTPTGIVEYLGDYNYYVAKKEELIDLNILQVEEQAAPSTAEEEHKQERREQKKERRKYERIVERVEREMAEIEAKLDELNEQMHDPALANDHEQLIELQTTIDAEQEQHDSLSEQWLEATEQLEQLE